MGGNSVQIIASDTALPSIDRLMTHFATGRYPVTMATATAITNMQRQPHTSLFIVAPFS
jgi:hypothetical protein